MVRILALLDERNYYLEKFSQINERELRSFAANRFEGIDSFYDTREKILKIIQYIESELSIAEQSLQRGTLPSIPQKNQIKNGLDRKQKLVKTIMEQDLQILAYIEKYKSHIIKELKEVQQNRKGMAGYKSRLMGI